MMLWYLFLVHLIPGCVSLPEGVHVLEASEQEELPSPPPSLTSIALAIICLCREDVNLNAFLQCWKLWRKDHLPSSLPSSPSSVTSGRDVNMSTCHVPSVLGREAVKDTR